MATWLILVVAAFVLAVIGATAEATWLIALAAVLLVAGVLWAFAGRRARNGPTLAATRGAGNGDR